MSYIPVIDASRLANDAVTSAKILDGTIANADIASGAAIALSKLATDPLARANHTGTQTASTISDFDTQVRTSRLDQMAAAGADVSMGGYKVTNVAAPVSGNDAANKSYVDGVAAGLVDYKASVRVAASTNVSLSGLTTIDGVSVAGGDRVLLFGQTTAADNGIYVASAGTWARATDADTSAEVTAGMYLAAEEGTNYADSVFLLATDNPITLGSTALTFIELPSIQDLIAGTGITKTGNTLDVGAGTGITVDAANVNIDTTVVPRKAVANTFTAEQTMQSRLVTQAGVRVYIQSFSANHTFDPAADHFMVFDTSAASRTLTLPSSHSAGDHLYAKRNGANSVIVATADSDTIDGSSSDLTLTQDQETALLVSDGTNWHRF